MWRNIKWKKSPRLKCNWSIKLTVLVFTSHQKTRVLRGFPRKQKLNGKKTAYFVQYMVSTRQKKEREKKGKKEKEFVD